ncbi:MAG: N-acetylneuraminate synthase [Balneolaceae bacterium]|nr:N-acetylneuraminate synthase [Balneolaceae bacterium]
MKPHKVTIIAEAGVNHNGSFEKAKQLVDAAVAAGADYVKFQTFKAEKIVSKLAKKAAYQAKNVIDTDESQFSMLKKLEMPDEWHFQLYDYCNENGIGFLSTPFDEESLELLDKIGMDLFKIPSGEITNKPYLELIAKKGKPVIMSTGMATFEEVNQALTVLLNQNVKREDVTILHCNTQYPTPFEDVNLMAMVSLKNSLNIKTGYSDHTLGIEVPIAAVALGATVIEKHFTLNRDLPGPDHKASLEPEELKNMVSAIRNIEMAISGDGKKEPSKSEISNISVARKSLHLKKSLKKGEMIKMEDIVSLRPGDGISPMQIDQVIGKQISRNLSEGSKISWSDLK